MKHDHIEINGTKYRVEFNWNAITDFLESENMALTDADDLRQLKPSQVTGLIYAGVVEGCRLENTPFQFSKLDFGAMISPPVVGQLLLIYQRQTAPTKQQIPEREAVEGQKKRFLSRFRSKNSSS